MADTRPFCVLPGRQLENALSVRRTRDKRSHSDGARRVRAEACTARNTRCLSVRGPGRQGMQCQHGTSTSHGNWLLRKVVRALQILSACMGDSRSGQQKKCRWEAGWKNTSTAILVGRVHAANFPALLRCARILKADIATQIPELQKI